MAKYESWFDSKFYHILYKNRDDEEARQFIDRLLEFLKLPSEARIWDMACGRGRHCIYLNKKGFTVTGTDQSPSSIAFAKSFQNEKLFFEIHDMREAYKVEKFDLVLNLFTSFGYFENKADNLKVFNTVQKALKNNGVFVMDFMNVKKILKNLVNKEEKTVDGINFKISRTLENNFIKKNIAFNYGGKDFNYLEQVESLNLTDFTTYFEMSGLKLINLFGDYQLSDFDQDASERLIMVCKKL